MKHEITFVRQGKLSVDRICLMTFESDTHGEPIDILTEAITAWVDHTPEGRKLYEDSYGDFNVGDMLCEGIKGDHLEDFGIFNLELKDLETSVNQHSFDLHLYQGENV